MSDVRLTGAPVDRAVVKAVLKGDFRAIARLITRVENVSPDASSYLRELFPHTGRSFVIGITGAAGSGKSTLMDRIASHYRKAGKRVGILAVDPSSPYTGGAILGDRIRMQSRSVDSGTFIRSMATRGHLGGLAPATADVLLVLDAAGFDIVLVETVGVGQDEVEIVRSAHVTLVLMVPGMGDDIQAMKAGLMEIGDIFVINKADHTGVERVETELKSLLSMSSRADGWQPRIIRTVATENRGIDGCVQEVETYRSFLQGSELQNKRALTLQRERLLDLVRSYLVQSILEDQERSARLEKLAEQVAKRELDPYSAAEQLLRGMNYGPKEKE